MPAKSNVPYPMKQRPAPELCAKDGSPDYNPDASPSYHAHPRSSMFTQVATRPAPTAGPSVSSSARARHGPAPVTIPVHGTALMSCSLEYPTATSFGHALVPITCLRPLASAFMGTTADSPNLAIAQAPWRSSRIKIHGRRSTGIFSSIQTPIRRHAFCSSSTETRQKPDSPRANWPL